MTDNMSIWAKIWLMIGFISAILGYSLHPYLWDGAFYHMTSIAFVAYTRVIYLQTTGSWSLAAFVVWLTTVNSLLDEFLFDPKELDYNEYIAFLIIIIITVKQRDKWTR